MKRRYFCSLLLLFTKVFYYFLLVSIGIIGPITTSYLYPTILMVARDGFDRLYTVAFYDRVLVLDQGRVAEYDTPLALLDNPDSEFRAMCEKVGAETVACTW